MLTTATMILLAGCSSGDATGTQIADSIAPGSTPSPAETFPAAAPIPVKRVHLKAGHCLKGTNRLYYLDIPGRLCLDRGAHLVVIMRRPQPLSFNPPVSSNQRVLTKVGSHAEPVPYTGYTFVATAVGTSTLSARTIPLYDLPVRSFTSSINVP